MPDETCWTVIRAARAGEEGARASFVGRYGPVVRAYLRARWRGRPLEQEVDDAAQDVFVECFRDDGVLQKASSDRLESFQRFLLGVVRNVALRFERERATARTRAPSAGAGPHDDPIAALESDETHLSRLFDRAFARSVLEQAAALHEREARKAGGRALLGVELLKLRFDDGLPIRDVAQRLQLEPEAAHKLYASARAAFHDALRRIVAFHLPNHPEEVGRECERLVGLLR